MLRFIQRIPALVGYVRDVRTYIYYAYSIQYVLVPNPK